MRWEYVKIGDCCEITSSKRIFYSEYVDCGVPFYRSKEIIEKASGQDITEPLYISKEKYIDIKQKFGVPKTGDLLLTSVGTIGVPYIVKENDYFYFKDGNLTWFKNFNNNLVAEYLYYWLKSDIGYKTLNNTTIGSSQKALTISSLKEIKIPCPPIKMQKEIVAILSSYDDLIENNQKQIKLFEEAAQRLYKEWFVDLRFPGHEDVAIVDGVPEGWRKDRLGNCVVVKRGGSPRPIQEYLTDKGLNWLKISDATSANGYYILDIKEHIDEAGLNKTVMLKKGSLVLSNSATPGIPKILDVDSCIHDGWLYFSESYFTNEFLFLLFLQERANLIALGTGAVFTNLKTDIVKNYSIIVPNKNVLDEFQKIIEPIFAAIKNKQNAIKKLSEARDRLLPKLMSGELEVLE